MTLFMFIFVVYGMDYIPIIFKHVFVCHGIVPIIRSSCYGNFIVVIVCVLVGF
jgi:hypothetical protein